MGIYIDYKPTVRQRDLIQEGLGILLDLEEEEGKHRIKEIREILNELEDAPEIREST